jgi:hypothetical protein
LFVLFRLISTTSNSAFGLRVLCDASASVSRRRITNGTDRFTLAKLGVHYDRDYYTLLQLPSTIETSVLEIPAREEGAIFIAVF